MTEHGTRARYLDGCRCDVCRHSNAERGRTYRVRKARESWGAPTLMVDADPVRAHVRSLMAAGVGWKRIAAHAGLGRGTVAHLLYGQGKRGPAARQVHRTTADALYALRVEDCVADRAYVDASGTRRRLQALVAVGWTQTRLACHLGIEPTNLPRILTARRVPARRVRQVRELYSRLWDQAPPEDVYAERARTYARERRWPLPAAWDDDLIDLPEGELAAELGRRAAVMDDGELAACHTAHYKQGDISPMVVAGAHEYGRRKKRTVPA